MSDVRIRRAVESDVDAIVALANALDAEDGGSRPFTAERVARFGFRERPVFTVFLAEIDSRAIGYAMVTDSFNSERAAPGLWLVDLYVAPQTRRRGVAQKLMRDVAREALARGAESVWLGVRNRNAAAMAFYAALGALDDEARILEFNGDALTSLANQT